MKLAKVSEDRFYESIDYWEVPLEFAETMYNYLVYGFSPGGFFTAVLANDYHGAIGRSHPLNTIAALKALSSWMANCMPREALGSYDAVTKWCNATPAHRRKALEQKELIYTPKEETWMAVKGETV